MSQTAQNLYFHLGIDADDDGFVSPKMVMRLLGSTSDDLNALIGRGFIIPFQSGVIVIRHWRENNYIQADRYKPSIHINERNKLLIDTHGIYQLEDDYESNNAVNSIGLRRLYTTCIQDVHVGKDSIGKDSIDNTNTSSATPTVLYQENIKQEKKAVSPHDIPFDVFWDLYPRKVEKKKALQKWNKLKPETKKIIIADLPKRKMQSQWMKGFVPHPTTYLNGERWNDELEDSQITEIPTFKGYKIN
jgi:hypothetical protein